MNDFTEITRSRKSNKITNIAWIYSSQKIADYFMCYKANGIMHNVM